MWNDIIVSLTFYICRCRILHIRLEVKKEVEEIGLTQVLVKVVLHICIKPITVYTSAFISVGEYVQCENMYQLGLSHKQ